MQIWLCSGFLLIVGFILAIDLGLINGKVHAIRGTSAMNDAGAESAKDSAGVMDALPASRTKATPEQDARA